MEEFVQDGGLVLVLVLPAFEANAMLLLLGQLR